MEPQSSTKPRSAPVAAPDGDYVAEPDDFNEDMEPAKREMKKWYPSHVNNFIKQFIKYSTGDKGANKKRDTAWWNTFVKIVSEKFNELKLVDVRLDREIVKEKLKNCKEQYRVCLFHGIISSVVLILSHHSDFSNFCSFLLFSPCNQAWNAKTPGTVRKRAMPQFGAQSPEWKEFLELMSDLTKSEMIYTHQDLGIPSEPIERPTTVSMNADKYSDIDGDEEVEDEEGFERPPKQKEQTPKNKKRMSNIGLMELLERYLEEERQEKERLAETNAAFERKFDRLFELMTDRLMSPTVQIHIQQCAPPEATKKPKLAEVDVHEPEERPTRTRSALARILRYIDIDSDSE